MTSYITYITVTKHIDIFLIFLFSIEVIVNNQYTNSFNELEKSGFKTVNILPRLLSGQSNPTTILLYSIRTYEESYHKPCVIHESVTIGSVTFRTDKNEGLISRVCREITVRVYPIGLSILVHHLLFYNSKRSSEQKRRDTD